MSQAISYRYPTQVHSKNAATSSYGNGLVHGSATCQVISRRAICRSDQLSDKPSVRSRVFLPCHDASKLGLSSRMANEHVLKSCVVQRRPARTKKHPANQADSESLDRGFLLGLARLQYPLQNADGIWKSFAMYLASPKTQGTPRVCVRLRRKAPVNNSNAQL